MNVILWDRTYISIIQLNKKNKFKEEVVMKTWKPGQNEEAIVEQNSIRSSMETFASLMNLIAKSDSMKLERVDISADGQQVNVFYLVDTETY